MDRVVAAIGNSAITESDVMTEYRFELFLQGRLPVPPPDRSTLVQIRDRLIEQKLLSTEAEAEGIKLNDPPSDPKGMLEEIRKKFGSDQAFQSALQQLGLDEPQIGARMAEQEKLLRMIDQRFRPAAWPEPEEVEAYYHQTFVPQFAQHNAGPPPPLAEVEGKIREILVQRNINKLLGAWLEEMKSTHRVKIYVF